MTDSNDQVQKVGGRGVAMQAGGDINYGLTLADMKQLAADLFEAQFLKLQGVAADVARERADAIREDILEAMRTQNPTGVEQAGDVDFQHALYGVQRDYARTGDEDLGDLLVTLLVDRSKVTERNLMQIVLNESLATAAKLTSDQIKALGLLFVLGYTTNSLINNRNTLLDYIDKYLHPLVEGLATSSASMQYIAFIGCGTPTLMSSTIATRISTVYPALFSLGHDQEVIPANASAEFKSLFIDCPHAPGKVQIGTVSLEVLKSVAAQRNISTEETDLLIALFGQNQMSADQVMEWLIQQRPWLGPANEIWKMSGMHLFQLTAVGQAVGHASIRRFIPEFGDLSIWIH